MGFFTDYDGAPRVGRIVTSSVAAVMIITGLSIGTPIVVDAINASTAPITSKLNEKTQVYTGTNRIQEYNKFYDEYTDYTTDMVAVADNIITLNTFNKTHTSANIASDPTGDLSQEQAEDQQAVNGAQEICASAAETFNNDSKKVVTGAQFKGVDLSKSVSVSDCQVGNVNG